MADPRHELGRRAEGAAATWLTARGWTVLERRWRCPAGELDLICRDATGALVGVEVKVRSTGRAGTGSDSVDRRRVARVRAALATYARAGLPETGLRIDLVTLEPAAHGRWRIRRLPAMDAW